MLDSSFFKLSCLGIFIMNWGELVKAGKEDRAVETASIQTKPELRGVEERAVKIT